MPGSGDSIQALKAGVMEIPDVIVVNKADHPMTDTMVREVRGVLALSQDPEGWKVPILRTEAARGEGVVELAEQIDAHRKFIEGAGTLAERRARNLRSEVLGIATARMRRRLEQTVSEDPATADLLDRVVRRELDPATAASELLEKHVDD
jgi:LAO/AO transport system kinase